MLTILGEVQTQGNKDEVILQEGVIGARKDVRQNKGYVACDVPFICMAGLSGSYTKEKHTFIAVH